MIIMLISCNKGPQGLLTADNSSYSSAGIALNITQPQDESVVRTNPVTVSGSVPVGIMVVINGISVSIDNNHFSATVQLETGPNMIEVLARDQSGKETIKYLNIVYVP
jgi:hypothetical protein